MLLNGEQLEYKDSGKRETVAGKLAIVLASGVNKDEGKRLKNFNWASSLMNEKKIEVDEPDFNAIKESVANSQIITDWEAGTILSELDQQAKKGG